MQPHTPSKRVLAAILLYSHILMSCFNPILDHKTLQEIEVKPSNKQSALATSPPAQEKLVNEPAEQTENKLLVSSLPHKPNTLNKEKANHQQDLSPASVDVSKKPSHKKRHALSTPLYKPGNNIDHKRHKKNHATNQPKALPISQSSNQQTIKAPLQGTAKKALVGKTFTTRAGEEVAFYQEADRLRALVKEKIGTFTRTLVLPVYGADGSFIQNIQAKHIHIVAPEQATDGEGCVYIGSTGLLGGMRSNKRRKISQDAQLSNEQYKPEIEQYRQELIKRNFSKILEKIGKQLQEQGFPCSCFISYAWHKKQDGSCHELDKRVHQIAEYLWLAGIRALLDIKHNPLGTSISEFVRLVDEVDYVIWIGSKALKEKCTPKNLELARAIEFEGKIDTDTIPVVSREAVRIEALLKKNPPKFNSIPQQTANTSFSSCFLLPLYLEGTHEQVFPDFPLLKRLNITSEPMSSLLPTQEIFKLLQVMVSKQAGQSKFIQEMELEFKQKKEAILAMSQDKLAVLLAEEKADQQTKNIQLQEGLLAAMHKEIEKIKQRSAHFQELCQKWHLKHQEAELLYQVNQTLLKHYRQQGVIQLLDDNVPTIPLDSLYVNLVVVKEEQKEKEKKQEEEKKQEKKEKEL